MNWLLIGDVHAKPTDLEECERLLGLIERSILDNKIDGVWFAGDQTHYHDLVHNTVLLFWKTALSEISRLCQYVFVSRGNHDGEKTSDAHSMMYFKYLLSNVVIVDRPFVFDNKLFLPYYGNNERFISICQQYSDVPDVLGHEEFNTCMYDNGFYIKNGVNPEDIPQKSAVMGHIHLSQKKGKVWYIGSPRWLTQSDENTEKYIWVTDFKDKFEAISTKDACSPILRFEIHEDRDEGKQLPALMGISPRVIVDLHGSVKYIQGNKQQYEKMGFKVRTFPPKMYTIKVKESEGLVSSFNKFTDGFNAPNGTSKERLNEIIKEKIKWEMI
jgi:DNA repair exonuclease SbcCD nuclease subunit